MNAEVLLIIQQLNPAVVFETNCTTLNSVEHFCGMETKHRRIAEASRRHAFILYSKSMGGIIDYFQSILFCNSINFLYITEISINMYWHNCNSTIRNKILNFCNINGIIFFINITKYWYQPVSDNSMRSRSKCEWCSNYFSTLRQIQCRNSIFQCQMTVCIKCYMWNF